MISVYFLLISIAINSLTSTYCKDTSKELMNNTSKSPHVVKRVLPNGMTILVRKVNIPKVSLQVWYRVGSKDEEDNERGIAHLIEHMIFKGTNEMLSESDINIVTHMLSGSCNAFTSYDYTGYLFNLPVHHWQEALPILADCMTNARFDEQMLSSEMKAVIQELKMYRDKYVRSLVDELIGAIFPDHPYHHPIIGYKQDLWSVHSGDLREFYQKHYAPNNATLVVVGNVDEEDVFSNAEKYFSAIPAKKNLSRRKNYHNKDIVSKSVVLYRDIQQPLVLLTFVVPGSQEKKDHLLQLLSWVIGKGKSSRLYKKLVDELHLATSLDADAEDLFEYGLFYIVYEPTNINHMVEIESIITDELRNLIKDGPTHNEVLLGMRQTQMNLYDLLEDTEAQAYEIGKYFLATNTEDYVFNYLNYPIEQLITETHKIISEYLRPSIMHKGMIMPLPQEEKDAWKKLQDASDLQDEEILSARIRTTPVEEPRYANTIIVKDPSSFNFPKPTRLILNNGLKVLYCNNTNTPKIDIILDLKADSHYDPQDRDGLCRIVSKMMLEGTKTHTGQELAYLLESRGISLNSYPGSIIISLPQEELEFSLSILHEILTEAKFDQKNLDKIKQQTLARIKSFWDDPMQFTGQLIREKLYTDHPYSKNSLGTNDSIGVITLEDVENFYRKYVSPCGSRLVIVGDLTNYNIEATLDAALNSWNKCDIEDLVYPTLNQAPAQTINYPINRDQVVLALGQISIARKNPDYDKLLLFDQIFGGGVLGSMSSRLFDLREQSGLFYTISGSLIANADEQPGMFLVRTIVSNDRLEEAKKAICNTIDHAVDTLTEDELIEAKHALINSIVDYFSSNQHMASAFLFLDKYDFPFDYFDTRTKALESFTVDDIKATVRKYMSSKNMLTFCVGRVGL